MSYQIPPRPDYTAEPAPKKKTGKGTIALVIIGGLLVLGWIGNAVDGTDTSTNTTTGTTVEITAADIVDTMGTSAVSAFCEPYVALGEPYAEGYVGFKKGYGAELATGPSSQEIYAELVSRC